MNEERPGLGKVIELALFRKTGSPIAHRPYAYSTINSENVVNYGIEDVSATDSLRLLRGTLALCVWLLDVYEK